MPGVFTNMAAIVVGGIIGVFAGSRFPEKLSKAILETMGVFTIFIGIKGAFVGEKSFVCLIALVAGTIIGTLIDLDMFVNKLGEFLKKKFSSNKSDNTFVEGFVNASVLFGIGAMAILGSIDAGIRHDFNILLLKSAMDFVSAIVFATTLGIGVCFSAVTILVLEGGMTLLAGVIKPLAENQALMNEIACCGNILIMIIGFNMLKLTKIKVANMLPAVVLVPIVFFMIK